MLRVVGQRRLGVAQRRLPPQEDERTTSRNSDAPHRPVGGAPYCCCASLSAPSLLLGWTAAAHCCVNCCANALTPLTHAQAEGVELDRHYTYQWCSPTRSSFISGRLPIHIAYNVGGMCKAAEGIPRRMTGLGTKLKSVGYRTVHYGKVREGTTTCHSPHAPCFCADC